MSKYSMKFCLYVQNAPWTWKFIYFFLIFDSKDIKGKQLTVRFNTLNSTFLAFYFLKKPMYFILLTNHLTYKVYLEWKHEYKTEQQSKQLILAYLIMQMIDPLVVFIIRLITKEIIRNTKKIKRYPQHFANIASTKNLVNYGKLLGFMRLSYLTLFPLHSFSNYSDLVMFTSCFERYNNGALVLVHKLHRLNYVHSLFWKI